MRDLGLPDKLVYTTPTGVFTLYVQMCMVTGLILAMPYLLLQVWGFISPGLYERERRYAIPFIFLCSALFLAGAAFAYFVAFPATLRFLLEFSKQFTAMITVNEYFSLAIMIILGLALVFELPVLILFLTLLRIWRAMPPAESRNALRRWANKCRGGPWLHCAPRPLASLVSTVGIRRTCQCVRHIGDIDPVDRRQGGMGFKRLQ